MKLRSNKSYETFLLKLKSGKKEAVLTGTYEHNFGLIIPQKSGVIFEQQTSGVSCDHAYIEGVFILLREPYTVPEKGDKIDWLIKLTEANYGGDGVEAKRVWREIDKQLFFTYKKVDAPKNQPTNDEGLQWIKIERLKKSVDGYKLSRLQIVERNSNYGSLVGKVVALIYPNCD